jgi:Uncharacterized conserved protein
MKPTLYRKRLIPNECVLLDKDIIIYQDDDVIISKWNTIRPKKVLHHGVSCYFLEEGIKVSKFFDKEDNLLYWYCDIITHTYNKDDNSFCFIDLLADVIIYPDGRVLVMDLDELADATEQQLITNEQLQDSLRKLNKLLQLIYSGKFANLQKYLDDYIAGNSK